MLFFLSISIEQQSTGEIATEAERNVNIINWAY